MTKSILISVILSLFAFINFVLAADQPNAAIFSKDGTLLVDPLKMAEWSKADLLNVLKEKDRVEKWLFKQMAVFSPITIQETEINKIRHLVALRLITVRSLSELPFKVAYDIFYKSGERLGATFDVAYEKNKRKDLFWMDNRSGSIAVATLFRLDMSNEQGKILKKEDKKIAAMLKPIITSVINTLEKTKHTSENFESAGTLAGIYLMAWLNQHKPYETTAENAINSNKSPADIVKEINDGRHGYDVAKPDEVVNADSLLGTSLSELLDNLKT